MCLSRGQEWEQLTDAPCLVVPMDADEALRTDLVPIEKDLRAAGVLAQHGVRVAEGVEHAERDVPEVPDRRRADDQRHG